jgi:dCTP deaminase
VSILNEVQMLERLFETDVKRKIVVTPLLRPEEQFGPTSLDLRLGTDFHVMRRSNLTHLDPVAQPDLLKQDMQQLWQRVRVKPGEPFILHPGEFALAATLEHIQIPLDIAARLEGRSTWGRLGLQIHATAGFVDPGFSGALTFELSNVSMVPLSLYPGVRIAQICFYQAQETLMSYTSKRFSKYSGKTASATSAFYQDPEYHRIRQALLQQQAQRQAVAQEKTLVSN